MFETINENGKDQDGKVEPRRSKRSRIEKSFSLNFLTYILEKEPQIFKGAMNSTEGLMWKRLL